MNSSRPRTFLNPAPSPEPPAAWPRGPPQRAGLGSSFPPPANSPGLGLTSWRPARARVRVRWRARPRLAALGPRRPAPGPAAVPCRGGAPATPGGNPEYFGKLVYMDYKHLGRTGLLVSPLCLGTMNFGPETTEPDSHAIMDYAHELGINFFDTANRYGGRGATESIIGRWFAQGGGRREKTVLATKLYGEMDRTGPTAGSSPPSTSARPPMPRSSACRPTTSTSTRCTTSTGTPRGTRSGKR